MRNAVHISAVVYDDRGAEEGQEDIGYGQMMIDQISTL
jgi:hypothetical protein